MAIDLSGELTEWLATPDAEEKLTRLMRRAVRAEIREALSEELLDTEEAAALLNMSEGALRKAVQRGQVPCVRIGRRLRYRRSELIRISASTD